MSLFDMVALLLSLAALFSLINYKTIKLPNGIGIMLIGLLMSIALIVTNKMGLFSTESIQDIFSQIDFNDAVLNGMLSFLLFAGALHVNINRLAELADTIAILATIGVAISAGIISVISFYIFNGLGIEISYLYCLLFGVLISPTDPIAVMGILKKIGAPKSIEVKITGESLFNDGIAVVFFIVVLELATGQHEVSLSHISLLFAKEAIGGAIYGFVIGYITYLLLKAVDDYQVEVLITLALVTGGYSLAQHLHVSGPIAIVIAGLMIGNRGRKLAMSENTRKRLDDFWELIDEVLNALLFLLIGVELLIIQISENYILASLLIIPTVLIARFISVGLPVALLKFKNTYSPHVIKILTWGGLRGGISVALALSIPLGPWRDPLLTATYGVVIFSILVQGLTIGKVAAMANKSK
ncbi:MAG: sodium:proton antiporter [Alcanivoracaceae bacterium]|nr:sodium:proton antiporter [Alcanivoracaceae bacterium]